MPLAMQAKLLRALQEGEFEPLGSNRLQPFDARVIAATSRDLGSLVREGRFREDLFYRLNVLPVRVPPLRERQADLPALVEALTEDLALRSGGPVPELSQAALDLLATQAWRGNIRELRNVLEQATMRCEGLSIEATDVRAVLEDAGTWAPSPVAIPALTGVVATLPSDPLSDANQRLRPLAAQVAEVERAAIAAALQACGGNKVAAAKLLGISRAKLYERMVSVNLDTV